MNKKQYADIICSNKHGNVNGNSCKLNQIDWFKEWRRIYRSLLKLSLEEIETKIRREI